MIFTILLLNGLALKFILHDEKFLAGFVIVLSMILLVVEAYNQDKKEQEERK